MRVLLGVAAIVILSLAGFVAYGLITAPFEPAAYEPSPAPAFNGPFSPNERLQQADLLGKGQAPGPEDVDEDAKGRIYAGLADGRILRINGERVETFADTGGRPLGLAFDPAGNLIVADAIQGLLRIAPDGTLDVLVTEVEGTPLGFTDDVDVASDGTIYFSDASSKWSIQDYQKDVLEMRPHGRLLRYRPDTGTTDVLLHDLYFANGVALSPDEDFVLVNETSTYRILRYWLQGERAGQVEIWADNLPGFPDGISRGQHPTTGQAIFWVALFGPRVPLLDAAHPRPWLKKLLLALPESLQPAPPRLGLVLVLDEQGQVLTNLQDPSGEHLYNITSVQQVGDRLYFGSLHNDRIGRLSLKTGLPD